MLSPIELKKEVQNINNSSDYVVEYIEECHELVTENKLDDYTLVYRQIEKRAEGGQKELEKYFGVNSYPMAGGFASALYEGDFEKAFLTADKNNATVLASMRPQQTVNLIKNKWGEESLERNLTARVRQTVAEDILKKHN